MNLPVQPASPGIFGSAMLYNGQTFYAAATNQDVP